MLAKKSYCINQVQGKSWNFLDAVIKKKKKKKNAHLTQPKCFNVTAIRNTKM